MMTSEWTICVTPMPTEEALDIAARIADAEEPDCEDLLLTEGARVCDVLRCEVLHQAEVIERRTAELSTATGEVARLRAGLEVAQTSLAAATSGRRVTVVDEIERLQRERDALQDAAREYLDAETAREVACDTWLRLDGHEDGAHEDMMIASSDRMTAARTRLAALVGGAS